MPRAKRKLKDITFNQPGAHIALVSKELNEGPANLQDYALVLKGVDMLDEEMLEKASMVKVDMPIEQFLQKFFGLYSEDAEVLARAMGYRTSQQDYDDMDDDEKEESYKKSYKDYIEERVASFQIMKSLKEEMKQPETAEDYLQLLQDQEMLEGVIKSIEKESAGLGNAPTGHDNSTKVVEKKVGHPALGKSKQEKGKTMPTAEEIVEIQKAKDEAIVELQKAKEAIAALQKEKQEAIQKARKESVLAVVKNKEQAEVFAKAAALFADEADVVAFVKALGEMQALADKSELFKEIGSSGEVEPKADDHLSAVKKALAAKIAAEYKKQ